MVVSAVVVVEPRALLHWRFWFLTLLLTAVAYVVASAAAGGLPSRHVVLARPDPLVVLRRRAAALRVCSVVGPWLCPAVCVLHARKVYLSYGNFALALSQPMSAGGSEAESTPWRVHAGNWKKRGAACAACAACALWPYCPPTGPPLRSRGRSSRWSEIRPTLQTANNQPSVISLGDFPR